MDEMRNLSDSNLSNTEIGRLCQRFATLTPRHLRGIPELEVAIMVDVDRRYRCVSVS